MNGLPPQLADAIEQYVARAGGAVATEVERLSAAYRGEERTRDAFPPHISSLTRELLTLPILI